MKLTTTAVLMFTLGLGTTITFTSSHWLMAWMGMEINTLAILPIIAKSHHPRATEAATKYFLIQAAGAATLLFATAAHAWVEGHWHILNSTAHPMMTNIVTMALVLKMGLAPLHPWLPEVMQGVDLLTALILATWQKLAPFVLMIQVQATNPTMPVLIGILSIVIGGWGGLNQTQLRKILAYSSIAHFGWMMLAMQFSTHLALLALVMYIIMTFSTFLALKTFNATTINALSTSWTKYPLLAALTPLIMLSLAGLPPLSGFMPKWLILSELSAQHLALPATVAALSALLSLYFYLRLAYAIALTTPPNNLSATLSWRTTPSLTTLPLAITTPAALGLLPLAPMITALLLTT
uniref:NADH dehydrogenase subunit 2 n=1 Tax=Inegocia japonica TaxID=1230726 RepID=UPI00202992A7|nr:NADH dehydrogenase subunit 2 [Inegocia japonica]UPT34432.1 NADH dehydrogenase subunit 2 [Inegocia japonica]